jgi:hypothetical protein
VNVTKKDKKKIHRKDAKNAKRAPRAVVEGRALFDGQREKKMTSMGRI